MCSVYFMKLFSVPNVCIRSLSLKCKPHMDLVHETHIFHKGGCNPLDISNDFWYDTLFRLMALWKSIRF